MAIKTQMRLNQITASFGSALGEINDSLTNKAALDSIYTQNLSGSLSFMASAIRRTHGGSDFSNQTAGLFSHAKSDFTGKIVVGGDTAANDAAAIGYTVAEGIIITGQGGTNDVTIKNDADADVLVIPTGTTNVDIVGIATAATFRPDGDTGASMPAAIGYTASEGIIITGQGTVMDITIKNDADAVVLEVPTGTTNVVIPGNLIVDGTTTTVNTAQLMVEDKLVVLGIAGGMTLPGVATYTVSSNVVTVTSNVHGLSNGEFVLIQDPAATEVITEGVYLITSVADGNTFTFAFTTGDVGATPINHSVANVTNNTASGSGIMAAPGSVVETSLKWTTTGWAIGGPAAASAGLYPNVTDSGALGTASRQWSDLFLAEGGVIDWDGGDFTLTQANNLLTVAGGELRMDATQKLEFRDATEFIHSDTDGHIHVDAGVGVTLAINTTAIGEYTSAGLGVTGTGTFSGVLTTDATTEASAIGTAALVVDGGASVAKDIWVGDDIVLDSDGAVLNFGDTQGNVTLTHVVDAGLRLNAAMKLEFGSAAAYIQHDGTDLKLADDADINLVAGEDILLDATGGDISLQGDAANAFARLQRASATVGYLNFNGDGSAIAAAGADGWGFRNNAGAMEFKDSGGSWAGFSAAGGGSRKKDSVTITAQATNVVSKIGGFLTATTGSLDVFLNGQLMLSGAGGLGSDYNVTAAQTIKFNFNVEPDDVVTFILP